MNEPVKLKPCPFCGGEAETKMYLWGHHSETGAHIWRYYAYCIACDAMTDNMFESKAEAIAAWNRRADRTGRWIEQHDYPGTYSRCSACDQLARGYAPSMKFCPNCGAHMIGG